MGNMQSSASRAWDTALRRRILLVVHDGRARRVRLKVFWYAIQMIVEGESNEGKGGDTKGLETPEGAILEDSRMWVEGERWRWKESVVLMGTLALALWFGLGLLRSRAILAA